MIRYSLTQELLDFRLVNWLVSPIDRQEKEISKQLKGFVDARKEELKYLEKDEIDSHSVRNSLPPPRF